MAALMAATPDAARAADFFAPPVGANTVVAEQAGPQSMTFGGSAGSQSAPALRDDAAAGLPEGNQWRYSEFIAAVESGKVERVRFSKDGSMLQVRARRQRWGCPRGPALGSRRAGPHPYLCGWVLQHSAASPPPQRPARTLRARWRSSNADTQPATTSACSVVSLRRLSHALLPKRQSGPQPSQAATHRFNALPPLPHPSPPQPPQLTAIDGRRATVTLPNDPDLVDILAKNGVDISVSEGEQQVGARRAAQGRAARPCAPAARAPLQRHAARSSFLFRACPLSAKLCATVHARDPGKAPRPLAHTPCPSFHPPSPPPRATTSRCWATSCSPSSRLAASSSCSAAPRAARAAAAWAAPWAAPWTLRAAAPSSRRCPRRASPSQTSR